MSFAMPQRVSRRSTRLVATLGVALFVVAAIACAESAADSEGAAGLATEFDSTRADSVIARTVGAVPAAAVRRVVEEVRIAPEADDTSLFADVFEFDVGPDGRMYVFDGAARVLFLFDSAGALERRVGRQGAGPGEFNGNNGMVVLADGRLAQWDARNGRISFFSPSGDFLTSWVVPTGFSTSNGLRTDRTGALYMYRPVTPPRDGEILGRMGLVRLHEGGALGDSLIPPDLPVDRLVYVASIEGSTSATNAAHAPKFVWAWHPDAHFLSVSTGSYAIEASRPERPLRIVRDAPAIPVSAAENALEQERITANLRGLDPAWTWRGPSLPTTKAPVRSLFAARDGRLWVGVTLPSEEIPEAEREQPRPNGPPPRRYREGTAFEIFEASGRFLGRVRLPTGATLMEADGDVVWYLHRDADGLPAVVRARVEPGLR